MYHCFKSMIGREEYLDLIKVNIYRTALARFRLGTWCPRSTCTGFVTHFQRQIVRAHFALIKLKTKHVIWLLRVWKHQKRVHETKSVQNICNGVEWSKDRTQAAEFVKNGDHSRRTAAIRSVLYRVQQQTIFSTDIQNPHSVARIDKRAARSARNTRYRYNQIGPLDHKMADNSVSLARTNTVFSTITKLIKSESWKTSLNKSYSYNLLNHISKMYTHDSFYLQQEWEAWLAPVYKHWLDWFVQRSKSQLTQCTKY